MHRKMAFSVFSLLISILLVQCGGQSQARDSSPTRTPLPDRSERPSHYSLRNNWTKLGEYVYRDFVQFPQGVDIGPDGYIYAADEGGRHVLRIAPDGTLDDLGLWKNPLRWKSAGPHDLEFDSQGNLYVINKDRVYILRPDGSVEILKGVRAGYLGGIAISAEDDVYLSDRNGEIFTISAEGEKIIIIEGLAEPERIIFGADGLLYVHTMGDREIKRIDLQSGEIGTLFEVPEHYGPERIYFAVDAQGDLWLRLAGRLMQFDQGGEILPYTVGAVEYTGDDTIPLLGLPGGMAFDAEGQLWTVSYTSPIKRFTNPVAGEIDGWESLEVVFDGFNAPDIDVDQAGNVYATNTYSEELWKIDPNGNIEVLLEHAGGEDYGPGNYVYIAVTPEGVIFLARPDGKIVRLDESSVPQHYADVHSNGLVIGSDGVLYAESTSDRDNYSGIVRITGPDQVEVLTTEIDGYELGSGPDEIWDFVSLQYGWDEGIYVIDGTHGKVFFLGFDGQGSALWDLAAPDSQPSTYAVSPEGLLYFWDRLDPFGFAQVVKVHEDGRFEIIVWGTEGDPLSIAISLDGEWLYMAENGAIDKIPLR